MKSKILIVLFCLLSTLCFAKEVKWAAAELTQSELDIFTKLYGNILTINFESSINLTETVNIDDGITLNFIEGSVINIGNEGKLIIDGKIEAGLFHIFNLSENGMISGKPQIDSIHPEWFGIDGVNDEIEINIAADLARKVNKPLFLSSRCYNIMNTLDFSSITVWGKGTDTLIKADAGEFHTIEVTSSTTSLNNFRIDGGWPEETKPQLFGNAIHVKPANDSGWIGRVNLSDISIVRAKANGIYIERAGYCSLESVKVNVCGQNALEIYGFNGSNTTTTTNIYGSSIFSDTPFGYGIKIRNGIDINIVGATSENTKGVLITGNDNRNINITGLYLEKIIPSNDPIGIEVGGSGLGLNIINCYGVGTRITYNKSWYKVNLIGNMLSSGGQNYYTWNVFDYGITSQKISAYDSLVVQDPDPTRWLKITQSSGGHPPGLSRSNAYSGAREFSIIGFSQYSDSSGSSEKNIIHFDGFNLLLNKDNGGKIGIGTNDPKSKLHIVGLPTFESNNEAIAAGLTEGALYKTSTGQLMIVY